MCVFCWASWQHLCVQSAGSFVSLFSFTCSEFSAAEILPSQIGAFHAFSCGRGKSKHFPSCFAKAPSAAVREGNLAFFSGS